VYRAEIVKKAKKNEMDWNRTYQLILDNMNMGIDIIEKGINI